MSFFETINEAIEDEGRFIGSCGIVYILCYDPFHQIYNKTGKI